jgi:hypothetical protein
MADTRMSPQGMEKWLREQAFALSEKQVKALEAQGRKRNPYGGWIIERGELKHLEEREKVPARAAIQQNERTAKVMELVYEGGGADEHGRESAWALYNGLTEYADHVKPIRPNGRDEMEVRKESALWGSSAQFKQQVTQAMIGTVPGALEAIQ